MTQQTDIFGKTVLHINDTKDHAYRVLQQSPEFRACEFAHAVAMEIVRGVGVEPIKDESTDTIVLERAAYYWIVESIPSIERYIRDFNIEEEKRARGHVPIYPVSDNSR